MIIQDLTYTRSTGGDSIALDFGLSPSGVLTPTVLAVPITLPISTLEILRYLLILKFIPDAQPEKHTFFSAVAVNMSLKKILGPTCVREHLILEVLMWPLAGREKKKSLRSTAEFANCWHVC